MKAIVHLTVFVACVTVGCRIPNQFESPPASVPHVMLRATKYPQGGRIFASQVNGRPLSFWRSENALRISPGTNDIAVAFSDRRETFSFERISFVATAGREFEIIRQRHPEIPSPFTAYQQPTKSNAWVVCDARDRAVLREIVPDGSHKVIAEGRRIDYIFGASSSEDAIIEYRKGNP
jgi:hypothetical protein